MKRPSQFDVAKVAGVSRATVSVVLNGAKSGNVMISDETRKRVWDAITALGYVPDARARALRSGDTKTLGLLIPDMHNPHFWETAEGVEQEARESGYHLLLSSIEVKHEFSNEIFNDLLDRRIDGLIMMGALSFVSDEADTYLKQIFQRHLPVVEISSHISLRYQVDRVASDYRAATSEAMAYLLGLNHRWIALLYGVEDPELAMDRLQPYEDSLKQAGITIDPQFVVHCGTTIDDGYQAARTLLQRPNRPTAIIAINDILAIGALRAITDAGLQVPADVSLIGYDDISISKYVTPRLTTVSKDINSIGRAAVKLLLARIQDPDRAYQTERRSARLIIRESTGPAPY
jgi:LacI family transcriptional regulator